MLARFTPSQRLPVLLAATAALWALLFLFAAMAGFGGRYRLHPDDPSLVPPLPRIDLSQAHSPLETLDAYAAIGQRPLFNADRRPAPPPSNGKSDADSAPPPPAAPLEVALTSVVMTKDVQIAIVTDNKSGRSQSVRLGNSLEGDQSGWKLVELEPRKAVFEGSQGRSEVELRVFDGSGGQPPTPVAAAPSAPPARSPRGAANAPAATEQKQETTPEQPAVQQPIPADMSPEQRSEMIRKRIEERRRQMREEAERNNSK